MERDELLLRGRLALEAAEAAVGELLELDSDDAQLHELRGSLRRNSDRIEAVQLDAAISAQAREDAIAR